MADSPSEVWEMISNLRDKSKTAAQTELVTLQVKINCYFITEWYSAVLLYTCSIPVFSDIWIVERIAYIELYVHVMNP